MQQTLMISIILRRLIIFVWVKHLFRDVMTLFLVDDQRDAQITFYVFVYIF
jgi:hypothetical protein